MDNDAAVEWIMLARLTILEKKQLICENLIICISVMLDFWCVGKKFGMFSAYRW